MRTATFLLRAAPLLTAALVAISCAQRPVYQDALDRGDHESALKDLRPLAESGDAHAQRTLGDLYFHGRGVPQDYTEAVNWYKKAGEQGDELAKLGECRVYRARAPQRYTPRWLAALCFAAMHSGLPEAQYEKADWILEDTNLGTCDPRSASIVASAAESLRKAADQGHSRAQARLASLYLGACGVGWNKAEALRLYRSAAGSGDSSAQVELADVLQNDLDEAYALWSADGRKGDGPDYSEVIQWNRRAAGQGNPIAHYNLAQLHEAGRGVPQDHAAAAAHYRAAAEGGLAPAQYRLGLAYAAGRGVARDDAQAAAWFGKAVAGDYRAAQFALGHMLASGRGVKKDEAAALEWFRKAAAQGHVPSQLTLGYEYRSRPARARGDAQAAAWIALAGGGEGADEYAVGELFAEGIHAPADAAAAERWSARSARKAGGRKKTGG